jgi:hypothetical protein
MPLSYACRSPLYSSMMLAARDDFDLLKIASIVVHTVQAKMHLVCEPIEQKRRMALDVSSHRAGSCHSGSAFCCGISDVSCWLNA